ncbi:beta-propeller fold lactonase family protein [uncultured Microbacterium sp.]|uniref:lactonase family protein n=1 Tax=uncultured Microbacterium sp. TaxID=191216 RepID=UPI002629FA6E|nr:beta-propeller fold lactonase family protein [uncultured Microbacterium sp.]
MTQFWVGGYGSDMGGDATGIGLLEGDEGREPTTLAHRGTVADAASPSWLVRHPLLDIVYAALEGSGHVQAFQRTGERSLRALGDPIVASDAVCHLAVAPSGDHLIASCYGDGRVVRIGLDAAGRTISATGADAAADPYGIDAVGTDTLAIDFTQVLASVTAAAATEEKPRSGLLLFDEMLGLNAPADPEPEPAPVVDPDARVSHAHAAAFLPDGRIATTDLGLDLVRIWRPAPGGLVEDHRVVLPLGVGPRHLVVHPSGHVHVVTEYSCEVFTLETGIDGQWALAAATTVSPGVVVGVDFPAELSRSRDGETLYAGVRGSNTIAALRVRGDGSIVEPLALAESGVDWPRHHLVHDGALLVAGQRSDQIGVIELDERTGVPRGIRHRTSVPAPTCILLA